MSILEKLHTPSFAVDRALLRKNAEILDSIRKRTGAKVLLALKAFSMFSTFKLLAQYLDGTCASSPHEARMGKEEFGKEVHSFAAAYSESDFKQIIEYSDHVIFNSLTQYEKFYPSYKHCAKIFGLRINPQHSEGTVPIYDPCAPFSRLGITLETMPDSLPQGITGLHFHTLCEQDSFALERTLGVIEKRFSPLLHEARWLNIGGGHHITRRDYDVDHLCGLISHMQNYYNLQVYLEPGEAVALNSGFLLATVLDIVENGMHIAVLDASAAAHTPDVIEMPYRPHVIDSAEAREKEYTYRFTGLSCLAGDVFGDYSFDKPLHVGDRIIFTDMAIYSMVKTSTFNGLTLPDLVYYDSGDDRILHKKTFGYEDFRGRLS